MLFSGSCTTKAEPPPPMSVRNIHDLGLVAPNRSRSIRAYSRRPARNFATSSKILPHAVKLKEMRGANSSTSMPRRIIMSTYAAAMARPYAISCAVVQPASRM
jgi:hypothetical protein